MIDRIFSRLAENKPVLIAEIGVNYYDIARVRECPSWMPRS